MYPWDVFIAHASDDKDSFVDPLADRLKQLAIRVWYDKFTLLPGDRLSEKIGEGLAKSRCGLLVISKAFLSKLWASYELSGLVNRFVEEQIPLIPIWLDVSRADVANKNPALADLLSIEGNSDNVDSCALEVIRVVRPQIFENLSALSSMGVGPVEIGRVNVADLQPGPIRHHDLPDSLMIRIQNLWFLLRDVLNESLPEFIEPFQRELHPEKEVEIFERISGALQIAMDFIDDPDDKKTVFFILLRFTMGNHENVYEDVKSGKLREEIYMFAGRAWLNVVPEVAISDVEDDGLSQSI